MASPWRARRARFVVLAAIMIVLAGTVASYLYRRRMQPSPLPGPAPMAEDVGQQTHSFSLSKTRGEHTLYTIHAEQVTNFEDTGKALLHNVSVLIYGKDGSRQDRITSPECYYDPAAASIWIPGEVRMQFDLPGPKPDASAASPSTTVPISVWTSQLSFDQNTGVATTDAPVRFVFAQGDGTSKGAAYDPEKQVLTLLSEVHFEIVNQPTANRSGDLPAPTDPFLPEGPTLVSAGTVHFVRETGRAVLEKSVEITRGARRIRAARGQIELDKKRRVRQAVLSGALVATEETPTELRQAHADRGTVLFSETGRVHSLDLNENVSWSIHSRPGGDRRDGLAQHVELFFREADGLLSSMRAEGEVRMIFSSLGNSNIPGESQTLSGGKAELTMAPDGKTLRRVRLTSSPRVEILPAAVPAERRTVTAEQFLIGLDERGELNQFHASGNVHMVSEETGEQANRRETTSDRLEASFGTAGSSRNSVNRIRQWGHFEYRDPERQARAEEATYVAASETVVLAGHPVLWNSEGRMTADHVELETQTGKIRAEGEVSSTFYQNSSGGSAAAEPLHAAAERMRYEPAGHRSYFEGHAKLWQGEGFLVEASALAWSQQDEKLTANDGVYSVFREMPGENRGQDSAEEGARASSSIAISADTLLYQRPRQLVRYEGAVRMQSANGTLTTAELDILLHYQSAPSAGAPSLGSPQIERAIAQRQVKIVEEDGRVATGDHAEYYPASNQVQLQGKPAKVVDDTRGTVEGVELTYFLGDDRIQIQGSPSSPTETRWHVHP